MDVGKRHRTPGSETKGHFQSKVAPAIAHIPGAAGTGSPRRPHRAEPHPAPGPQPAHWPSARPRAALQGHTSVFQAVCCPDILPDRPQGELPERRNRRPRRLVSSGGQSPPPPPQCRRDYVFRIFSKSLSLEIIFSAVCQP